MRIKIPKAKIRPIQIEPWFFRYLNEGELKVLSAIIAHADYKNRQDNSFASNRTLAFYCGFGLIESEKERQKYEALTPKEQIKYKKKKINNAIQTVKNTKQRLEEKGVITREVIDGKSYAVVDLDWSKEKYLKDFDLQFNKKENEETNNKDDKFVERELEELLRLKREGNISIDSFVNRLEKLQNIVTPDRSDTLVHPDDVDLVTTIIMNDEKTLDKLKSGEIKDEDRYKNKISNLIKDNKFTGVKKYYDELLEYEIKTFEQYLKDTYITFKQSMFDKTYSFAFASYDKKHKIFRTVYKSNIANDTSSTKYIYSLALPKTFNNLIKHNRFSIRIQKLIYSNNYISNCKLYKEYTENIDSHKLIDLFDKELKEREKT